MKDGTQLATTTTNTDGTYNLNFISTAGVFDVAASYPGHETSTQEITINPNSNNTIQETVNFQLGMNDVYVSPNGNDSNPGTQASPYRTIQKGVDNVNPDGTVHLANGTYTGTGNKNLTIDKNLTITGEDQSNTIIDAEGSGTIFTIEFAIDSAIIVTLQNLTLKNGNADYGGAINNTGTVTVDGSTFTGNTAFYNGGAIANWGTATVNFNRIIGNTASYGSGSAISNQGGTVDATLNWWGSNLSNDIANQISGTGVTDDPWIILSVTASPSTIVGGGTSMVTADLLHDSNHALVTGGQIPDGATANFTFDPVYGSMNPANVPLTNAVASSTLTALNVFGTVNSQVTVDGYMVETPITIEATADLAVTKTVNHAIQYVGKKVIYTITATNNGPSDATGVKVIDLLPNGLKFVWASSTSYNSSTDTWTIGNLANGATETLKIVAKILHTGTFTNTAIISGDQPDTVTTNNQASATVTGVKKPCKPHEPKCEPRCHEP